MLVAADSQGRCGCPEPEARPLAKTLVVLCGPPAVGKMAVGRELSALTGMPLFHNHLSIEAVLPVFGFGTPPFNRLVTEFRERVLTEAAESDLPGLLFTYVWAFDRPGDLRLIESPKAIFECRGGRAVFAELWADQCYNITGPELQRRRLPSSHADVARRALGHAVASHQRRKKGGTGRRLTRRCSRARPAPPFVEPCRVARAASRLSARAVRSSPSSSCRPTTPPVKGDTDKDVRWAGCGTAERTDESIGPPGAFPAGTTYVGNDVRDGRRASAPGIPGCRT